MEYVMEKNSNFGINLQKLQGEYKKILYSQFHKAMTNETNELKYYNQFF